MELSESYNPYDFANPVSDTSLLVGREKEMDEIKYYLGKKDLLTIPSGERGPINVHEPLS